MVHERSREDEGKRVKHRRGMDCSLTKVLKTRSDRTKGMESKATLHISLTVAPNHLIFRLGAIGGHARGAFQLTRAPLYLAVPRRA